MNDQQNEKDKEWEIFLNYLSGKALTSKIYKELKQLSSKVM